MTDLIPVRILIVGDNNVGKSTLVQALCPNSSSASLPGCAIHVRPSEDGRCIEEYYNVTGDPRFSHGRSLFFGLRRYDAIVFVYDATDTATRTSVSCTWIPEVMRFLGDVGAMESGGRLDGAELHVKSIGVINELRYLWRQTFFSYSAVSIREALADTGRLSMRFIKLWLNETGLWPDSSIDRQAELAFLSTSVVPVAIAAMKTDLINKDELFSEQSESSLRGITYLQLHKRNVAHDPRLRAFLKRAAETARRKTPTAKSKLTTFTNTGQIMLNFM